MIKTIIFDIGGTLVDGPDLFKEISKHIESKYGLNIEKELKEEFNKLYDSPEFHNVKTILDTVTINILINKGVKQPKIIASKIYKDLFLNRSSLFDESKEILEYLKSKEIQLIVVSDADSDILIPELEKLGILEYFDDLVISSDINCYKTSKDIIKYIDPLLNVPKQEILFVGDSGADINTAKNLNIRSVFINRKDNNKRGDITIRSLLEIKKLI